MYTLRCSEYKYRLSAKGNMLQREWFILYFSAIQYWSGCITSNWISPFQWVPAYRTHQVDEFGDGDLSDGFLHAAQSLQRCAKATGQVVSWNCNKVVLATVQVEHQDLLYGVLSGVQQGDRIFTDIHLKIDLQGFICWGEECDEETGTAFEQFHCAQKYTHTSNPWTLNKGLLGSRNPSLGSARSQGLQYCESFNLGMKAKWQGTCPSFVIRKRSFWRRRNFTFSNINCKREKLGKNNHLPMTRKLCVVISDYCTGMWAPLFCSKTQMEGIHSPSCPSLEQSPQTPSSVVPHSLLSPVKQTTTVLLVSLKLLDVTKKTWFIGF